MYRDNQNVNVKEAVKSFLSHGKKKVFGNYRIEGDELNYRARGEFRIRMPKEKAARVAAMKQVEQALLEGAVFSSYQYDTMEALKKHLESIDWSVTVPMRGYQRETLAMRLTSARGEFFIGNSTGLSLVGRRYAWGNEIREHGEREVQKILSAKVPMLPFSVFEQANLDITKFEIIQQSAPETVKRTIKKYDDKTGKRIKVKEPVHFTGSSLFKIEKTYFLFDIDREEIKHGIFNPFLVKLPNAVETIEQAYLSLKPKAVLQAEKKGLKVLRQGEWFFIPVKGSFKADKWKRTDEEVKNRWRKAGEYRGLELRAGPNRPNNAEQGVPKKQLVKGKISHSGREHRDIVLKSWHKAVPNTATESFTITGDVD